MRSVQKIFGSLLFLSASAAMGTEAPVRVPCGENLVCASDPQTVVAAMKAAGFVPTKIAVDEKVPYIWAFAKGYNYTIQFEDCNDGKQCTTLWFYTMFDSAKNFPVDLVNQWNRDKRLATMVYTDKGGIMVKYDMATSGGVSSMSFSQTLNWWSVMMQELGAFFQAHPIGAK